MQKTNFKTRLLALLTAAFMLVMCVPFAAFAEDGKAKSVTVNWSDFVTNTMPNGIKVTENGSKATVPHLNAGLSWYNGDVELVPDTEFGYEDVAAVANGAENVVFEAKQKKAEPVEKTVNVNINVDEGGYFTDDADATYLTKTGLPAEGKISLVAADGKSKIVTAKKGYKFTGWTWSGNGDGTLDADAKEFMYTDSAYFYQGVGNVTLTAKFEKDKTEPEVEKKSVTVNINVDADKGYLTEDGAAYKSVSGLPVEGKISLLTADGKSKIVTAKEGYKFTGWTWSGNGDGILDADAKEFMYTDSAFFYQGVGNVTLTAQFEKVKTEPEETKKTVSVTITTNNEQGIFPDYDGQEVIHFDNLDPNTDQQFELPKVEAKPGYEFIGWHVNGNEVGAWDAEAKTFGITGLAHFEEGSNVGCLTIAAVYKAETERTVEVTFSVDPDKGEFEKNDLYTSPAANVMKLTATEFDDTQYAIPTVKAKAGYKFVGWKGQGADVIAWDTEAKTFGVTGLCFFNGDDATTGYATVEAVFEKVEDKKNDNNSSSSSSSASSSSNKTTTASNEKQVVKAAAAPANTTKVLPKTGASNVAPLLGGSLAVVALLMGYGVYSLVLRKKD